MLAVDTNIVVRYVTLDDAKQSPRARAIVDNEDIYVATTVMLETEWVLRSVYRYSTAQAVDALGSFAGLPTVTVENAPLLAQALAWMKAGMDFADALHLAAAEGCDGFVSFDTDFVKAAKGIGGTKARLA